MPNGWNNVCHDDDLTILQDLTEQVFTLSSIIESSQWRGTSNCELLTIDSEWTILDENIPSMIEKLTNRVSLMSSVIETHTQGQVTNLDDENGKAKKLSVRISNLEEELKNRDLEIEEQENEIRQLKTEKRKKQREIRDLKKNIADLNEKDFDKDDQIYELKEKLKKLKEKGSKELSFTYSVDQNPWAREREQLASELDDKNKTIGRLELENEQLKELKHQLVKKDNELKRIKDRREREIVDAVKESQFENDEKLETLRTRERKLKKELNQKEDEIVLLEECIKKMKKRETDYKETVSKFREKQKKNEQKYRELQREIDVLRKEKSNRFRSEEDMEKLHREVRNNNRILKEELRQAEDKLMKVNNSLIDCKNEISEYKAFHKCIHELTAKSGMETELSSLEELEKNVQYLVEREERGKVLSKPDHDVGNGTLRGPDWMDSPESLGKTIQNDSDESIGELSKTGCHDSREGCNTLSGFDEGPKDDWIDSNQSPGETIQNDGKSIGEYVESLMEFIIVLQDRLEKVTDPEFPLSIQPLQRKSQ